MTEQEATKELERHIQFLRENWKPHPDNNVIEALGMAINALEKQIPKKPIDKLMYIECPACENVGIEDCGYCPACGQKLDWSEV